MTLQVVASPAIVILTTLEVLITLLEDIYSTGITRDDRNIFIVHATGASGGSKVC
jgi:hypothetical protein